MTVQLYSGVIDWEKIYSAFHSPSGIAQRIVYELDGDKSPLVFCGFAETAACLARHAPVRFVDLSPSVTARTSERFPVLRAVHTGDVTRLISSYPAYNIVIACRISAYWGKQAFDRLAKSLRVFPRKQVLIDFFDRDAVEPGQRVVFESSEGNGEWVFLDFQDTEDTMPPISKARLSVSYSLRDNPFSYQGDRSFFRKADIEQWCSTVLPEYRTRISDPLMDSDPSFTLILSSDC